MRKFYPPAPSVPTCTCGRRLTAADEQARKCPDCGAKFQPLLLGRPLPCAGCGYDLRQSPERCPECGVPVSETARQINREALRQIEAGRRKWWGRGGCVCIILGILVLTTNLFTSLTPGELKSLERGGSVIPERRSIYYTEIVVGWAMMVTGIGGIMHYLLALDGGRRS